MKELVKQEIHQLVDECDNDTILEDAKKLFLLGTKQNEWDKLESEVIQYADVPVENRSSLDEVFGLWQKRNIMLSKIREQQWERKVK